MSLTLRCGTMSYDLAARTHLMGVLNVTPDSFSDGGRFLDPDNAFRRAIEMEEGGADFIDIGGESTKPGSAPVTVEDELRRVLPVIERCSGRLTVPISIDTTKSEVARAAIDAGATLINDVSAGVFDPAIVSLAGRSDVPMILMHMQGTPATMQNQPIYGDVTREVAAFLDERAKNAQGLGVKQVIIDPGIGFGKSLEHNIRLIRELHILTTSGHPVLVGVSRKSFIGSILNLPVGDRMEGTAAAVAACIFAGVHIVRVHDVREMKRVAVMCDALKPLHVRADLTL